MNFRLLFSITLMLAFILNISACAEQEPNLEASANEEEALEAIEEQNTGFALELEESLGFEGTTGSPSEQEVVDPIETSTAPAKIVYFSKRALPLPDGTIPDAVNSEGVRHIWTVDINGNNPKVITEGIAPDLEKFTPQLSPNGKKVVFVVNNLNQISEIGDSYSDLWRIGMNGSGIKNLTNVQTKNVYHFAPRWSPNGQRILFISNRHPQDPSQAQSTFHLWTMRSDGTQIQQVSDVAVSFGFFQSAEWSPDGDKIVFVSSRPLDGSEGTNPSRNIYIVNKDGSGLTALTQTTASDLDNYDPTWCPDGRIVYVSERSLAPDKANQPSIPRVANLWSIKTQGGNPLPVTNFVGEELEVRTPKCGSDSKIAFLFNGDPDYPFGISANNVDNLYITSFGQNIPQPLTFLSENQIKVRNPIWTRDGKILYDSNRHLQVTRDSVSPNDVVNLWIVDPANTGRIGGIPLTQLTARNADSHSPVISCSLSQGSYSFFNVLWMILLMLGLVFSRNKLHATQ